MGDSPKVTELMSVDRSCQHSRGPTASSQKRDERGRDVSQKNPSLCGVWDGSRTSSLPFPPQGNGPKSMRWVRAAW